MYNPQELQRKAKLTVTGIDTEAQTTINTNNPPKQDNEKGWLVRTLGTVGDVINNVVEGAVKSIEGIVDAGAMLVGLFGADVDDFVSYDFTSDIFGTDEEGEGLLDWAWGKNLSNVSYLDDDSMVNQIAEGVGGMLPAIAVNFIPGVGPALSKAMFIGGASGNASEQALKEGATYGQAFGYGATAGAIEGTTEMIGGRAIGKATELTDTALGKLLIRKGLDKGVSQGVGKLAYTFVSEGVEEVLSDIADPINKRVWGVTDTFEMPTLKDLGKTFLVGGSVGAVLDGVGKGASAIRNRSKGGKSFVKVADNLEDISNTTKALAYLQQNKGVSQERFDSATVRSSERMMDSIENISEELQSMTEEQRKSAFETLRESTSFVDDTFNSDGTIKEEVKDSYADVMNFGAKYNVSSNIVYRGKEIENDIKAVNEQQGVNLELSDSKFTENQRKSFAKINRSLAKLNSKVGEKLSIITIKDNADNVNAFIDGNNIYLNEKYLENGKWARYLSHEVSHFAKKSKEFNSFAEYITKNTSDNKLNELVLQIDENYKYNLTLDGAKEIIGKVQKGEQVSKKESVFYDELVAHITEDLFTNEESINTLVKDNSGLAKKILNRIKQFLQIFKGTNADTETVVDLRKAEMLFEKALSSIGKENEELTKRYEKGVAEYKKAKETYNKLPEKVYQEIENKFGKGKKEDTMFSEKGEDFSQFIENVSNMLDESKISKRKLRIGEISSLHKDIIENLIREEIANFSAEGYEIWIDGTGAKHIDNRHGENGTHDHSMALSKDRKMVPFVVENPDGGEIIRDQDGKARLSNRFYNDNGLRAIQLRLYKRLNGDTIYVAECVPDAKSKRIYITSAYKKSSSNQLLNIDINKSPQPTPKASFDSRTTKDSIYNQQEKVNTNSEKFIKSNNIRFSKETVGNNNSGDGLGVNGDLGQGLSEKERAILLNIDNSASYKRIKEQLDGLKPLKIDRKIEYENLASELKKRNGDNPLSIDWALIEDALYIVKNNTSDNFTPLIRIPTKTHYNLVIKLIHMIDYNNYNTNFLIEKWLDVIFKHPECLKFFNPDPLYYPGYNIESSVAVTDVSRKAKNQPIYKETDSKGRKLTEEQIEFFKNSKVRDRYGRLQQVYHGTYGEFYVFDKALRGQATKVEDAKLGFFFSNSRKIAEDYSRNAKDAKMLNLMYNVAYGDSNILEALKNINPEELTVEKAKEMGSEDLASLLEINEDTTPKVFEVFLNIKNPYIENWESKNYLKIDIIRAITKAKLKKCDGVIIRQINDSIRRKIPLSDIYIVFEPNQIKLVTNKNPSRKHDIRFSKKSFSEQVDDVLAGADTTSTHLKVRDTTPKILVDIGLENKPMLITSVHTKTAVNQEVANKNIHTLSVETLKKLPKLLESPAIIMDSHKENSIVAFVNAVDTNNNPVMCAININGKGFYNNIRIDANLISSVYGKDTNPVGFIERAVEEDRVLYWDKKMSQDLFSIPGLQLPDNLLNLDSNIIIRKSKWIVNTFQENFAKQIKFSRKVSDGQISKKLADISKKKVYAKKEALLKRRGLPK